MRLKQILRMVTDLLMTILMAALMAYVLTGQLLHEWLGVAVFFLFVLHHILNLKWLRSLWKGRYTASRVLQTVLVFLLLASMLTEIISGIAMSRHALPFLDLPIQTSTARRIHLACGYWSFLLAALHLGFHWSVFLGLGRKLRHGKHFGTVGKIVLRTIAAGAAVCGFLCFVLQGIPSYLFLRVEFAFLDYGKPALFTVAELLLIMALWVLVGYLLQQLTLWLNKRNHSKTEWRKSI